MKYELSSNLPELTKKYASKERQQTADEIRSLRAQHFKQALSIETEIKNLNPDIQITFQEFERLKEDCRALELDILNFRNSILNRLFRHTQINEKECQLQSIRERAADYERKYIELSEQLEFLENARADKSNLREARIILNSFYQEQSKLLPEYEKRQEANERAASLENVIEDYATFFVHGIQPYFVPGNNSMLEKDTTWQEKLKIAIGFDPALSSSAIKVGDDSNKFWAHFGILLRKGLIMGAHSSDAATMAIDPDTRTMGSTRDIDLSEQVRDAIYRTDSKYNEFIIDDIKMAGLFLFPSEDINRRDYEKGYMPPHHEVSIEAARLGLPVFLFLDGSFVSARFDDVKQEYVSAGDKLNPKDVLKMQTEVSEEMRNMVREEVLKVSPFKMEKLNSTAYEEFSCLLSYAQGRKMFTGLYLGRNKISGGEKTVFDGQSVHKICEFPEPGFVNKMYVTEDGQVINDRSDRKNKTESIRQIQTDDYKRGYILIGRGCTWQLGSIKDIEDYVQLMKQSMQELSIKIDNSTNKGNRATDKNFLKRLASHCLGFAEQAYILGDAPAAEAAKQTASSIMNEQELKEMAHRRLGQNGEMIITENELYHIKKE